MGDQSNRSTPAGSGEGRHAAWTERSHTNLEVRFGINSLVTHNAMEYEGMLNLRFAVWHTIREQTCAPGSKV